MKMTKNKGILSLIFVAAFIGLLGFSLLVGFGKGNTGSATNIKLGLDLNGGVSITYETVDKNPTAADLSDTIYKLQKRVESYSTEATVYQVGDNRISIEIPGVSDANVILEELGKPGSLEFQDETGTPVLLGTDVANAEAQTSQDSLGNPTYVVSLVMTEEGTTKFAEATQANIGKNIAVVYDGEVVSNPVVNTAITDGQAVIEGMADFQEADILASTIRIGGLKLELEEISSNVVGAQLGEEAVSSSLIAGMIGLAIVLLFMCFVYLLPGVAASIALIIYTGTTILMINGFDITLTLPGIAGIILGIGMAVDANVIIFARVKEELAEGNSVKVAVRLGFEKALSAILDGNITTLIAAIVLGMMGSGTVKGFAYTLALGIVISMITALVVTRLIVYSFIAVGLTNPKLYGVGKKREKIHNVLKTRNLCFLASLVIIVAGFATMGMNSNSGEGAFNYSLDFSGGTATTVEFSEEYSLAEIDELIKPVVTEATGDNSVQATKVQDSNSVVFKTKSLDLDQRNTLNEALAAEFEIDESTITAENISSTVSSEMRQDAIVAVIIATICMLLYIWFRFKDIRFAGSAVIALVHDVLIVLAFYAFVRVPVGNTFIACMLTIVGYSINATIVIFDRIREEVAINNKEDNLYLIVNRSITHTLTRSIYTSFTTFVMVAVLYVLGVTSIQEFALPLMVGIIGGAYSSVCITGALWYCMKNGFKKQEIEKAFGVVVEEKMEEKVEEKTTKKITKNPGKKQAKKAVKRYDKMK